MKSPAGTPARIALTGGSGFLGSHVADVLLAKGYGVRAAVRPGSNRRWLEGKGIDIQVVDISNPASCLTFLQGTEGLIHCAGAVIAASEDQYRAANVLTTRTLLDQAERAWKNTAGVQAFIFISSLAAHGPAGLGQPALETDPSAPITAYGRSKLEAEKEVNQPHWSFRRAILRPPSLYGPRDKEFLPLFKAAARGITARLGHAMTGLSLVHGLDAAHAAVALLECDQAKNIFFVDDLHNGYSWQELAQVLETTTGKKIRTLPIPLGLLKFAGSLLGRRRTTSSPVLNPDRIRDLGTIGWVCDGSLLCRTTGWHPRFTVQTGFEDTMAFFKEHRWL